MSLFYKQLPSHAAISCLPQFRKMLSMPTTLGIIVKLAMDAPKIYKMGKSISKNINERGGQT